MSGLTDVGLRDRHQKTDIMTRIAGQARAAQSQPGRSGGMSALLSSSVSLPTEPGLPEREWIASDDIGIDLSYQRNPEHRIGEIKKMAASWSWAMCGSLRVSRREDGSLWVWDGAGRLTAAKMAGMEQVPCDISSGDPESEAKWFSHQHSGLRQISWIDRVKAGAAANIQYLRWLVGHLENNKVLLCKSNQMEKLCSRDMATTSAARELALSAARSTKVCDQVITTCRVIALHAKSQQHWFDGHFFGVIDLFRLHLTGEQSITDRHVIERLSALGIFQICQISKLEILSARKDAMPTNKALIASSKAVARAANKAPGCKGLRLIRTVALVDQTGLEDEA